MNKEVIITLMAATLLPIHVNAKDNNHAVSVHVIDKVISGQRAMLATNTKRKGFGPQSPRDIDAIAGNNPRSFSAAPASAEMNLCNIHFHKNAEHKGVISLNMQEMATEMVSRVVINIQEN